MTPNEVPTFNSLQDEIHYWRCKAEEYKRIGEDTRLELEEYQESSREVEAELETQLKQAESQVRELRTSHQKLHMEYSHLKEKFECLHHEHYNQVGELEGQVHILQVQCNEASHKIRHLEQTNDDLERTNRATLVSLEDFESRLHQAIERNAFLESELDDKESLAVLVQRLKDETKELKQELQVRQRSIHETPDNERNAGMDLMKGTKTLDGFEKSDPTKSPVTFKHLDSNRLPAPVSPLASNGLPGTSKLPMTIDPMSFSPTARHSALNIVGDLLRRVGALENKLSTCRTMVKESNGANRETTRGKLLTRGTSTNGVQKSSVIRA